MNTFIRQKAEETDRQTGNYDDVFSRFDNTAASGVTDIFPQHIYRPVHRVAQVKKILIFFNSTNSNE